MKHFLLLALVTLSVNCLVTNGHAIRKSGSSASTKSDDIDDVEVQESGIRKRELIGSLVQKKISAVRNTGELKASLAQSVAQKFEKFGSAKQELKNYIASKNAKKQATIDAIKQKFTTLVDYVDPVKENAAVFFNGALSSVKSEIERKKQLLAQIKDSDSVVVPANNGASAPSNPTIDQLPIISQLLPDNSYVLLPYSYESASGNGQGYVSGGSAYESSAFALPASAYARAENNYGSSFVSQGNFYPVQYVADC